MAKKSAPPRSKPKSTRGRTTKKKAPPGKGAESKAFKQSRTRAEKTLRDPKQTAKLVAQARKKLSESRDRLEESVDELEALIRLIQAYAKGDYRDVPWTTIVAAAGAVIYFVMPLDLIPDPLPGIGYADDVTVVLFVLAAIQRDVDAFERWEEKHRRGPSASRVSRKPRPKKSSGSAARHNLARREVGRRSR
jgi:uncharacterized membrane protein YkvA (DUF1232 family)